MKPLIFVVGAGLLILPGTPSVAQINPYRTAEKPPMANEDRQLLLETTERLNQREHPVVGDREAWSSSTSSGTARLGRIYRRQGMLCHTVGYELLQSLSVKRITGKPSVMADQKHRVS